MLDEKKGLRYRVSCVDRNGVTHVEEIPLVSEHNDVNLYRKILARKHIAGMVSVEAVLVLQ